MMCTRCREEKGVYNVVPPICVSNPVVKLCPSCFQQGIDAGAITWLGCNAFGVCNDVHVEATA